MSSPCLQAGLELLHDPQQEQVNMQGLENRPESTTRMESQPSEPYLEDQQEQVLNLEVQQENPQHQEDQAQRLGNRPTPATRMDGQTDGLEEEPNLTQGMETSPKAPPCHNTTTTHKKSYIDDLTLLEKISLSRLRLEERIIGPVPYHGDSTLN